MTQEHVLTDAKNKVNFVCNIHHIMHCNADLEICIYMNLLTPVKNTLLGMTVSLQYLPSNKGLPLHSSCYCQLTIIQFCMQIKISEAIVSNNNILAADPLFQ